MQHTVTNTSKFHSTAKKPNTVMGQSFHIVFLGKDEVIFLQNTKVLSLISHDVDSASLLKTWSLCCFQRGMRIRELVFEVSHAQGLLLNPGSPKALCKAVRSSWRTGGIYRLWYGCFWTAISHDFQCKKHSKGRQLRHEAVKSAQQGTEWALLVP